MSFPPKKLQLFFEIFTHRGQGSRRWPGQWWGWRRRGSSQNKTISRAQLFQADFGIRIANLVNIVIVSVVVTMVDNVITAMSVSFDATYIDIIGIVVQNHGFTRRKKYLINRGNTRSVIWLHFFVRR